MSVFSDTEEDANSRNRIVCTRSYPVRGNESGSGSSLQIALKGDRWRLGTALKPASEFYRVGRWSTMGHPIA